jgi:type VI secretion system protein ImpG
MSDELLPYYNEELSHIRGMAAEFAREHPKIAARLRISGDTVEDPHVERLIEAFAYLNARIRHKLDDDFPELSDAMLGALYPHYLAPIPSMAIVQLQGKPDLTSGQQLPAGVELETEPVDGEPCRFRTCYPLTLWPLRIDDATFSVTAIGAPAVPELAAARSVLKLSLGCVANDVSLADLAPSDLRFFLQGQDAQLFALYEALFNDLVRIAVVDPEANREPRLLNAADIRPVGFEADQGMLPYPAQAHIGYRLLTEFFAFPQKFLFFDLARVGEVLDGFRSRADIYFYFSAQLADLEAAVSRDNFALGCTPVVNLQTKRAEPTQLDHTVFESRIVPDARRPKAFEVYSVDRVTLSSADRRQVCQALYGLGHGDATAGQQEVYWHAVRRPAPADNPGSEVHLAFVDLQLNPAVAGKQVAHIETTCLNRDLPARLPFGGDEPRLRLSEGGGAIERIACLTAPTATLRPPLRHGAVWRLISHLNLNHLSLTDAEQGASALREILRLYDFRDSAQTRGMIEGIGAVSSRLVTARLPGSRTGALVRGVEVTVEFDQRRFSGSGVYLFAAVLERFLALYCGINSFTCLIATLRGREGVLCKWPPRAGERQLL